MPSRYGVGESGIGASSLQVADTAHFVPAVVNVNHAVGVFDARAIDYDEHLGTGHVENLGARWDRTLLCLEVGRRIEARRELDHLTFDCERLLPPGEPTTLLVRRAVEAVRVDPLPRRETPWFGVSTVGEHHPLALRAGWVRAHVLLAEGRCSEAMDFGERLVAEAMAALGPGHLVTLLARGARASALWALDRRTEAVTAFEDVASGLEQTLGQGHLETLWAWGRVAGAYVERDRTADALVVLERLEADTEGSLGHNHPFTRAVRERAMALVIRRSPSTVDPGGGATYDGPSVAARGGSPASWVWVANGTKAPAARFALPRSSSERAATPPDSLAAWLARAAARQRASERNAAGAGEPASDLDVPDAGGVVSRAGQPDEAADDRSPATLEVTRETAADLGPTATVAGGARRVELLVLGPIEASGWVVPPDRPVVVELACFLALHRHRAIHGEELRAALRPDGSGEVSATTLRSYVSFLRRALPPGLLPSASGGGYGLSQEVVTDWEHFVVLAGPGAGVDELRDALALVRGRPFAGVPAGTYQWAFAELLVSEMEAAVADAARRLAEVSLADDDVGLAAWATRQGLAGAPSDFGVWRLHLNVAARESPAALERARRDAVAALGPDADELTGGPDPAG